MFTIFLHNVTVQLIWLDFTVQMELHNSGSQFLIKLKALYWDYFSWANFKTHLLLVHCVGNLTRVWKNAFFLSSSQILTSVSLKIRSFPERQKNTINQHYFPKGVCQSCLL